MGKSLSRIVFLMRPITQPLLKRGRWRTAIGRKGAVVEEWEWGCEEMGKVEVSVKLRSGEW